MTDHPLFLLARSYTIALLGVAAFHLLQLPLPWLLGPICACLAAALVGVRLTAHKFIGETMRTFIGVAVGATLSAAVVGSMLAMWPTLLMIPLLILVCALIGVPYFTRLWGFDAPTSYYSAMPGGLQDMLVFGEEAGGDVRALSLIHATRIVFIVMVLPVLLTFYWEVDLTTPPGEPAANLPLSQLALMVAAALLGWRVAKAIRLFGAAILGPMIAAGALAVTGVLQYRPPVEAIFAAQFFIGVSVGTKYVGITADEVRRDVFAGLGYCAILVAIAAVFAEAAILLDLAPPLEAILAFAPGGQAEMVILALIAGADIAFVVAHHVLRIIVVIIGAPIAARFFRAAKD